MVQRRPADSPALKIRTFGRLRVFRNGEEIPTAMWRRRKSRSAFAYLLCARPDDVHKEELAEVLCPGGDADRTLRTLHVVISGLRAMLANGGPRREAHAFVRRVGEYYGLDVGPAGWVDVDAFEAQYDLGRSAEAAGDAQGALRHFEAADALYGGDFLVEERFADWAEALRDRLRGQYADALQRMVRLFDARGEVELAATHAQRLLSVDPYVESSYQSLMHYAKALGNLSGVVEAFLRCRRALREGFDSDVSPETRALAEKLLGASVEDILRRHGKTHRVWFNRRMGWLPTSPGVAGARR